MTPFDLGADAAPGWLPLLMVLILALALLFLWFSLRKQVGRIDVPIDPQHPEAGPFQRP